MIGVPLGPKRAAWRAVLFAQNALVRIFDDELQQECGTSLQVYDVLIRIWLAPEHTLRMSELAESALLSRSWITRRVERLEQSGLVERLSAGDDGRGVCVRLTSAGRETFARLDASHARSIERHFSSYLTEDEALVITRVLNRIAAAALEAPAPAPAPATGKLAGTADDRVTRDAAG
jgi:DNA-binding MarR family transcriptional regulator